MYSQMSSGGYFICAEQTSPHLATLPPCPAPAVNLYLALGRRGLGLRWAVAAGFCFGRATPPFAAQRSGCEGGAGPAPAAVRGYIWPRCRGSAIRIPAPAWCLLYLWFQLPKVCLLTTITGNPASTASSSGSFRTVSSSFNIYHKISQKILPLSRNVMGQK